MITKTQQILHLESLGAEALKRITLAPSVAEHFKAEEAAGKTHHEIYENAVERAGTAPLSEGLSRAFLTDNALDRKNPKIVEELRDTTAWVLSRLKACKPGESLGLQTLYGEKMPNGEGPGDITLYRAFEKLIACGAAEGISPYASNAWGEHIHKNHGTMKIEPGPKINLIRSVCTAARPEIPTFSGEWNAGQRASFVFLSEKSGEAAAEEAFVLLNSPEYDGSRLTAGYQGPSLSVGDIVEVRPTGTETPAKKPECFLCEPSGWNKKEGTLDTLGATPAELAGAISRKLDKIGENLRGKTRPRASDGPGMGM